MSDIDDIISKIDLEEINEEELVSSQDLIPKEEDKLDVTDPDEIADELVDMVKGDREKADQVFDLFYGNLTLNQDHTTASKEALTKSLELKIEASKNIIELLKIKAKAEEQGAKVGVFFGGTTAKKAGFDIDDIKLSMGQRDTE